MNIRIAAALLIPLFAGAAIARQPLPGALGVPAIAWQPTIRVHAAVARLAEAAPVALPAEPTSGNDSEVGCRNQCAPMPGFAGPGPGWG
jgi:hypothetical protein